MVMNNFNTASKDDQEHVKLTTIMFQNMFPSINVATTKLSSCQRVLLLEYNQQTGRVCARHYSVSIQPSGVSKNLKALVSRKGLPDMSRMTDISEFLTRSGFGSESEGEDAEMTRFEVPEDSDASRMKAAKQSRVKLSEVGPRLELEIVKVEEELCTGRVLYHKYVKKTKEEEERQQSEVERKEKEREKRRKEQEANVRKKQAEKRRREQLEGEDDNSKKRKGGKESADGKSKKRKKEWWEQGPRGGNNSDDDDAEWYRREVGEDPDEDFVRPAAQGKKAGPGGGKGVSMKKGAKNKK